MLTRPVSGALALVALVAVAGALFLRSARSEVAPVEASDPHDPDRAPTGGTLLLSVRIEPVEGVVVERVTVKPDLRYRAPRRLERMPFRWTMLSADGASVAEGGFDPGPVDLDPARAGRPEVVLGGDQLVPRVTWTNVKVPDVAYDRITFRRVRGGALAEPFGDATAQVLEAGIRR